jgi:hypothetical protein
MTVTFERPKPLRPEGLEASEFKLSEEAVARVAARAVVHCEVMLGAIYGTELVEATCNQMGALARSLTLNSEESVAQLKELAARNVHATIREQDVRIQRQRELEDLIADGEASLAEPVPVLDIHALEVATTALAFQAVSDTEWAAEAADVLASDYVLDAWELASGVREVPQMDALIGSRAMAAC